MPAIVRAAAIEPGAKLLSGIFLDTFLLPVRDRLTLRPGPRRAWWPGRPAGAKGTDRMTSPMLDRPGGHLAVQAEIELNELIGMS
jgi:hypothetical protein